MKSNKHNLLKYLFLIIIIFGLAISLYTLINNVSYNGRKPKTFTLDNDLFHDDFYSKIESNIQIEDILGISLPWNVWDLRDISFINSSSILLTITQYYQDKEEFTSVNQVSIDRDGQYDIENLAYDLPNQVAIPADEKLIYSSVDGGFTEILDISGRTITSSLNGTAYKVFPRSDQLLLIDNNMLIIEDINNNKRQRLISLDKIEQVLYSDYTELIEKDPYLSLEEELYKAKMFVEKEKYLGFNNDMYINEIIYERYEASGYLSPMQTLSAKEEYFFPLIYLNPWEFQISPDESMIYFKVDFGLYTSRIYSIDIEKKEIISHVEGKITSFKLIDNNKLIVQGSIDDNEGLLIYNIKDKLANEIVDTDVSLYDLSSDGKLAYITTNSFGNNELRIAFFDGEELKSNNIIFMSSDYINYLSWSTSGEELFYISDNMGIIELLIFKIKNR